MPALLQKVDDSMEERRRRGCGGAEELALLAELSHNPGACFFLAARQILPVPGSSFDFLDRYGLF